jgi:hypothetical protein
MTHKIVGKRMVEEAATLDIVKEVDDEVDASDEDNEGSKTVFRPFRAISALLFCFSSFPPRMRLFPI